jgi:hypothetical protein
LTFDAFGKPSYQNIASVSTKQYRCLQGTVSPFVSPAQTVCLLNDYDQNGQTETVLACTTGEIFDDKGSCFQLVAQELSLLYFVNEGKGNFSQYHLQAALQ